jgi:hypothetical protein
MELVSEVLHFCFLFPAGSGDFFLFTTVSTPALGPTQPSIQWVLVSLYHHSSVGIELGCGLDDRGSGARFPEGAGNFSLHHRVQNGSGVHSASYPMGTRGSFPGGKAAGS